MLAEVTVLAVVAVGAAWDLATGRIPNALTYPACVFALVLAVSTGGWSGLGGAAAGFAIGFLPFFALYLLGGMGGGDVKLMATVGAFTGAALAVDVLLASVLIGALIAVLLAIWEGQAVAAARFLGATVGRVFVPHLPRERVAVRRNVPFGVAIALGTFATLLARWRGLASPADLISGL